jgi:hypothetical protein
LCDGFSFVKTANCQVSLYQGVNNESAGQETRHQALIKSKPLPKIRCTAGNMNERAQNI